MQHERNDGQVDTAMSQVRAKGVTIARPIVYGNVAYSLGKKAKTEATHRWTLYVRGLYSEDVSYYIKKVSFKLHESFNQPVRVVDKPPFELHESGWGEFDVELKIYFQDASERPITLHHALRLYPNTDAIVTKKSIIAEKYDDIVFTDPTLKIQKALNNCPMISVNKKPMTAARDYASYEKQQITSLKRAKSTIRREISKHIGLLKKLENDIERNLSEFEPLEKLVWSSELEKPPGKKKG